MSDIIKVELIQGADENGAGGTVLDNPTVVMPDGYLQDILNAFASRRGLQRTLADGTVEEMSPARAYTYRLREFTESVLAEADFNQRRQTAIAESEDSVKQMKQSIEVID